MFPEKPAQPLDSLSETLISLLILFIQIRQLKHVHSQYEILVYIQVMNIPASVNTTVHQPPQNIDDDHCINVHIKMEIIQKSSYFIHFVNKLNIKTWLQYLNTTPLYRFYISIVIFHDTNLIAILRDELSEGNLNDSLAAAQMLLWNEINILNCTR